jgi:peptidoglycan/LPS O-acetylase OafA/YrhL
MQSFNNNALSYRPEIDGLRAVAVISVWFYHANLKLFSGGFIGVDIFFVISGYLITAITAGELKKQQFSAITFLLRRLRRLLPAMLVIFLFCIPIAWMVLPSGAMRFFSQDLIASTFFVSNIFFAFKENKYFNFHEAMNPLLHTWSLSVEMQYYFLFSLLILGVCKLKLIPLKLVLYSFPAISLCFAYYISERNFSASFFLLPTRLWQFGIGSLVAVYLFNNREGFKPKQGVIELVCACGLILIFISIFFSKFFLFPTSGIAPSIGTAMVIISANQKTTVGRLLRARVLVNFGLISFSVYLWHQPVIAFAKYSDLFDSDIAIFVFTTPLILLMSCLTYRFVELRYRFSDRSCNYKFVLFSSIACLTLALSGLLGHFFGGFPKAFATAPTNKLIHKDIIVIGDSHASHLISGLRVINENKVSGLSMGGCIPLRNLDRYDSRFQPGECAKTMNRNLDLVIAEDPSALIILSSMGPIYLDGTGFKGRDDPRVKGLGVKLTTDPSIEDRWIAFEVALRNTLTELSELKNATVIVSLDVPELGIENGCGRSSKALKIGNFLLSDFIYESNSNVCFVEREEYDHRTNRYKTLVEAVVKEFPHVRLFNPAQFFCDETKCKGHDPIYGYLYSDEDHLNDNGSLFYANHFAKQFMQTDLKLKK